MIHTAVPVEAVFERSTEYPDAMLLVIRNSVTSKRLAIIQASSPEIAMLKHQIEECIIEFNTVGSRAEWAYGSRDITPEEDE
jgi:hypothetical protein